MNLPMHIHLGNVSIAMLLKKIEDLRLTSEDTIMIREEDFSDSMVLEYRWRFDQGITNPFFLNGVKIYGIGTHDIQRYHVAVNDPDVKPKRNWQRIADIPLYDQDPDSEGNYNALNLGRQYRWGWNS